MNCLFRAIIIVGNFLFVLPVAIASTPFRWIIDYFTITNPDFCRGRNNAAKHKTKVTKVQAQVLKWNKNGRKKRMCTARPAWQTLSTASLNKSRFTKIKIDLEDIIEIDTKQMVLRVEPGIKMGTLTSKLLPQGWTIPVIPEFESLTVGGCVNGTGIESTSHKYGLFADSCNEFEIVLADGSVTTCSKDEKPDLFYSIPWSHGTIGFLTSVTIPIQRAGKYVRLEYHPTDSLATAEILLNETKGNEFVEGIAFNLDEIVVMHGRVVDEEPPRGQLNRINRWWKPFFYKHVESMLRQGAPVIEYIPLRDYYHRHQRGYFWEVSVLFAISNFAVVRYPFGWIFPFNFQSIKIFLPNIFVKIGTKFVPHVLQDFMVPMSKLRDIMELSHKEVKVYPVWLCPCKYFHVPGIAPLPADSDEMYIDIGVYGMSPLTKGFNIKTKIRTFEKFTTEAKGYQFLYADTFMTREEFGKMFHIDNYNQVREKYNCNGAFPEIYDKVSRHARS